MCLSKSFLLGADPEFGLMRGDKTIVPKLLSNHQFGLDGCGRIAELRPDPAESPQELVANIKKILQSVPFRDITKYSWKAGNMAGENPIGGHIHFGNGKFHTNYAGRGKYPNEKAAAVLDTFLAVPIALIEDKEEASQRRTFSYGNLGNFRSQIWGIEYRTLGSWLVSPEIATSTLALAKVLMYEFLFKRLRVAELGYGSGGARIPSGINEGMFDSRNREYLLGLFNTAKPRIESCYLYPEYKDEINLIFDLIASNKNWFDDFGKDMRKTWDIKFPDLRKVNLASIWKKVGETPKEKLDSAKVVSAEPVTI